jgi:serine phosphatase RsbU (regulator of sigma subunit)
MVCYTDGLTDRRGERRTFGEEGVVAAILHGRNQTAGEMAQRIEADAVGFVDLEPIDDMAVLVLRALSPPSESTTT